MGVTFCAVAPEHPLAMHAAAGNSALATFIEECKAGGTTEAELAVKDKLGMPTGLFVKHPLTGESVAVWVGNYVLMSYGDGAVMGVPAHDERDFAFALKYALPIKQVVAVSRAGSSSGKAAPTSGTPGSSYAGAKSSPGAPDAGTSLGLKNEFPERASAALGKPGADFELAYEVPGLPNGAEALTFNKSTWQDWYAEKGRGIAINSGKYDGLAFKACVDAVAADLAAAGLGEKKTTWRLRDWGVSRQRYWGTPIPIIHCDEHGAVPVPEKDLPVVLPQDCIPDGSGNPLNKHVGFHHGVMCPVCGKAARRETDTMDTFVDSSWYFMRYCDPTNTEKMVADGTDYWMRDAAHANVGGSGGSGMDQYIGGIEHAILHLLYARFWTKVMRDLGLVKIDEPFSKLLTQGMVLNHIYSRRTAKGGKDYFWPHDIEHVLDDGGKVVGAKLKNKATSSDGELPVGTPIDYEGVGTMSKSKNNGVDPQDLIERYGADTARLYTMFTAPPEATLEWNDAAVEGSYRFLRRVWAFAHKHVAGLSKNSSSVAATTLRADAKNLRREMHLVLKQVSYDYERMQYNTVVSGCMKLLNALEDFKSDGSAGDHAVMSEGVSVLLRMLYPACPHIADQLWQELGFAKVGGNLLDAPWPEVDEKALERDSIELMLQINGKLRGAIEVAVNASKEDIEKAALATEAFIKQANGGAPKKVIVVPGRLVNIVL